MVYLIGYTNYGFDNHSILSSLNPPLPEHYLFTENSTTFIYTQFSAHVGIAVADRAVSILALRLKGWIEGERNMSVVVTISSGILMTFVTLLTFGVLPGVSKPSPFSIIIEDDPPYFFYLQYDRYTGCSYPLGKPNRLLSCDYLR